MMNGRCCIGNNNDVSLFISAFCRFFFVGVCVCWLFFQHFFRCFFTFANRYCFEFFIIFSFSRSRKMRASCWNAHTNLHFMYRWIRMRFSGFLVIYWSIFCACWMNVLKMYVCVCMRREGREKKKEEKRNWHHQSAAQAFDSNPSLLMYLYLHTFILFPTFFFFFSSFSFVVIASQKCFLGGENGLRWDSHSASITVNKNEANISRVFRLNAKHIVSISLLSTPWAQTTNQIGLYEQTQIYCMKIESKNEKWSNNQRHLNAYELFLPNYFK